MTQQTDLFEGQAPEGDEPARDKRTLLVAGGLAALVLGAGAFFFLGGSDESLSDDGPVPVAASGIAATKPTSTVRTAPAAAPAVVPAESTFEAGRNPFKALYVLPVAAKEGTSTSTGSTGTSTDTTGGSTTVAPTSTTPTSPVTPVTVTPVTPVTVKPTTPAVVLHELVLQTVSEGSTTAKTLGTFLIDKKKYVVPVGQVFGPKSELVVVAYQQDAKGVWTAVLRVGDSAPFDAVQGDELNVM
jgi:hypothetical protein